MNDFENTVRQWLEDNCPAAMREPMPEAESVWGGRKEAFAHPESRVWLERMAEKGYLAPSWPIEYGGAGLSKDQEKILMQQLAAMHCRPALMSLGIWMMGPTIMEFGTEAQKLRFLPDIAQGKIRWCQGYSEPGAGSDLASLRCKAELDMSGEHYIVSGQKVWTSFADKSDFLFCLVRTDFTASKHAGITVLLIDMDSPGVSTKPIELISGKSHFCEVFLDHVSVPKQNLLGELNDGWRIAKRMLQHERQMMGEVSMGAGFNPDLISVAKRYLPEFGDDKASERISDPIVRDAVATNIMQIHAINKTSERVAAELKAGEIGMAAVILKYAMTLAVQDKAELLTALMGNAGLAWSDTDHFSSFENEAATELLFSKIQTIGGGTSEVQLNIIAKQVLQLPES